MIFKLEDKYKLANFTSIEWKPLNTVEIVSEDGARVLIRLLEKLEVKCLSKFNCDNLMEKVLMNNKLILGIDPGLNFTGWGLSKLY